MMNLSLTLIESGDIPVFVIVILFAIVLVIALFILCIIISLPIALYMKFVNHDEFLDSWFGLSVMLWFYPFQGVSYLLLLYLGVKIVTFFIWLIVTLYKSGLAP